MTRHLLRVGVLVASCVAAAAPSGATPVTFATPAALQAALGSYLVEDYSGIANGLYSNAQIDTLLGPGVPLHRTTGSNSSQIFQAQFNWWNVTYRLDFANATLGSANGVYGAGFSYWQGQPQMDAFVTFGDGSTQNYDLSATAYPPAGGAFFGITSDQLISQIHISLPTNVAGLTNWSFVSDDLIWGNAAVEALPEVPEPATLTLVGFGLVSVARKVRRRR